MTKSLVIIKERPLFIARERAGGGGAGPGGVEG